MENVFNEVVLVVVWWNKKVIDVLDIDEVEDCVIVGFFKKDCIIFDRERVMVVYYEVGYIIVGLIFLNVWVVYKVIIVLCGCVGGYMIVLFKED